MASEFYGEKAQQLWKSAKNNDGGSYHYVAFAMPGLTFSAEFARGIVPDYKALFHMVNEAGEPGLMGNATFTPVEEANYYGGHTIHRITPYTAEERIAHYKDVLEAQDKYVKAETIVLDLRDFSSVLESHYYASQMVPVLEEGEYAQQIAVIFD